VFKHVFGGGEMDFFWGGGINFGVTVYVTTCIPKNDSRYKWCLLDFCEEGECGASARRRAVAT